MSRKKSLNTFKNTSLYRRHPFPRFPVIPALLAGALVVGFGAFLYLINGKGADAPTIEEQVKANKPKAQGNTLPQEKWSYIERLENKQVDIIEPPPQPGVLPPPPAETLTLQPEKLPQPVPTEIPQPGTPLGQVKPFQPQPVQPTKPATGAPVASAQEQVINQKAERERMEREIRAELERERAEAAKAKAATQTAAADGGRYMMQCAALRSQDSAESLKARIAFGAGLSSSLQVVNGANGTVYKVMVGPFSGKAAVDAANRKLQGSGISGCIPKKG